MFSPIPGEMIQFDEHIFPPTRLVGGWTTHLKKYASQNGFIFPKVRGDMKYLQPTTQHYNKSNHLDDGHDGRFNLQISDPKVT